MKKTLTYILTAVLVAALLAGCGCQHETWTGANCTDPKTCADCGETEGAPLGHTWQAATCETPKTCETCGVTEGEALGHSWADAACAAPKTCSVCGLTEGEALGHSWLDATTEAPKTCSVCGETEGERIVTDERFTTESCQHLFGSWSGSVSLTAEDLGIEPDENNADLTIACEVTITFYNDGTLDEEIFYDYDSYVAMMRDYTIQVTYESYELMGYDRDAADQLMQQELGMTVEEYVDLLFSELTAEDLTYVEELLYYVEGTDIQMGYEWEWDFYPSAYTLEGDTLTIQDELLGEMILTRVTE